MYDRWRPVLIPMPWGKWERSGHLTYGVGIALAKVCLTCTNRCSRPLDGYTVYHVPTKPRLKF